jgi:hypothetical protein
VYVCNRFTGSAPLAEFRAYPHRFEVVYLQAAGNSAAWSATRWSKGSVRFWVDRDRLSNMFDNFSDTIGKPTSDGTIIEEAWIAGADEDPAAFQHTAKYKGKRYA